MERSTRIQQLYGYLVCIIAVITVLISSAQIVNAIFDLTRPANVNPYGPDSDASYESYRLTQLERATSIREKSGGQIAIPSDSAIRKMYEAQQRSRIAYARWNGTKSIVVNTILLIIALILFTIHWRWLRSLDRGTVNAAANG
jgi:hypothetical protein